MRDLHGLSAEAQTEIAGYIKRDNMQYVNSNARPVKVKDTFYTRYGKRFIDIIIAMFALTIAFPINLVIAIITYFDVGRPILFKQTRMGRDNRRFTIYKFRNMTNATDANGKLLPPSERVTKWGKFVRKTSLDELLNFVPVLTGSMSIIGPRPLPDNYIERLSERHKMVYAMRPGLECPPIHKIDHALNWQDRFENYVWYVENCSFWIDVKLMFRVLEVAFDHKSTAIRSTASNGGILGYSRDGNMLFTKACPDKYVEEYCRNHGFSSLEEAIASRNKPGLNVRSSERLRKIEDEMAAAV